MNTSEEFEKLVQSFYKNNHINDETGEKYTRGFRNRLGKFLAQVSTNFEEKQIIVDCIKNDYKYYSKDEIKAHLKNFHDQLISVLSEQGFEVEDCYFGNILNNETFKHNSSNAMINMYLEVNELPNNMYKQFSDVIDLEFGREKHLSQTGGDKYSHYDNRYYSIESERLKKEWKKRLKDKKYLILIDDYIGSGDTVKTFVEKIEKYIGKELVIIIKCIHATASALESLICFLDEKKIRGQVESDEESRKYFDGFVEKRDRIRKFGSFNLPLGYGETESVVTTYRNTPNNTIGLFWNDNISGTGWRSLFPRDNKSGASFKNMSEWVKEKKKIRWFMKYNSIPSEVEDKLISLLYIKNNDTNSSTITEIELSKIICYTDRIIQECQNDNYLKLTDNKYSLSDKGLLFLQQYSLAKISFNGVRKEYNEIAEQKETPILKL